MKMKTARLMAMIQTPIVFAVVLILPVNFMTWLIIAIYAGLLFSIYKLHQLDEEIQEWLDDEIRRHGAWATRKFLMKRRAELTDPRSIKLCDEHIAYVSQQIRQKVDEP